MIRSTESGSKKVGRGDITPSLSQISRLIGVSGCKRSGKDTIATFLTESLIKLDLGPWNRVSFAGPIKKVFCGIFGVDMEWLEEWKLKDEIPPGWKMNVRMGLINVGDRFREIKEDCWISLALRAPGNKIISDVRYQNEAWLTRKTGILIRVHRPGLEVLDDPSETDLLLYDRELLSMGLEGEINRENIPYHFFIINDGTIDDLKRKIEDVVVPSIEKSLKFFL